MLCVFMYFDIRLAFCLVITFVTGDFIVVMSIGDLNVVIHDLCCVITLVTWGSETFMLGFHIIVVSFETFMLGFYMYFETILSFCLVITFVAWVRDSFMLCVYMFFEIILLCCHCNYSIWSSTTLSTSAFVVTSSVQSFLISSIWTLTYIMESQLLVVSHMLSRQLLLGNWL